MGDEGVTMTNKHEKKKIQLTCRVGNGGGGGIAGLLVFGGALALAGWITIASFATNKNKPKPDTKPKSKRQQLLLDKVNGSKRQEDNQDDDEEATQGLPSILQPSTTPTNHSDDASDPCHGTSNLGIGQIDSYELLPTQTLILEEKIDLSLKTNNSEVEIPTGFQHQEIELSDDSHPESAVSSNGNEECLTSLSGSPCFQAQETEDDDIDEDVGEDDVVLESSEEDSSKGTAETSLNSNEEPVWPAELIEEAEQEEFKGGNGIIDKDIQSETLGVGAAKTNIPASADYCDSHVFWESGSNGSDSVTPEATLNKKANFYVVPKDQQPGASHSFELRTWMFPMLLLALLLLLVLVIRRTRESSNVLDDGNSVIIA